MGKRKAKEEHVSEEEVEQVDDADDPVHKAIELIVEARKKSSGSAQPQPAVPEVVAGNNDQQETPPEDTTPKMVSNQKQPPKPKREVKLKLKLGGILPASLEA